MMLPSLLGRARAAEILLLGQPLTAEEAAASGVISAVVKSEALLLTAGETAATLAGKPRRAFETKRLLCGSAPEIEQRMRLEHRAFKKQLASAEAQDHLRLLMKR